LLFAALATFSSLLVFQHKTVTNTFPWLSSGFPYPLLVPFVIFTVFWSISCQLLLCISLFLFHQFFSLFFFAKNQVDLTPKIVAQQWLRNTQKRITIKSHCVTVQYNIHTLVGVMVYCTTNKQKQTHTHTHTPDLIAGLKFFF